MPGLGRQGIGMFRGAITRKISHRGVEKSRRKIGSTRGVDTAFLSSRRAKEEGGILNRIAPSLLTQGLKAAGISGGGMGGSVHLRRAGVL